MLLVFWGKSLFLFGLVGSSVCLYHVVSFRGEVSVLVWPCGVLCLYHVVSFRGEVSVLVWPCGVLCLSVSCC